MLKLPDVLDGHLDDLRLFDAAAALLDVGGRNESGQVGQAAVHPVPATFFDQTMRCQLLGNKEITWEL